MDTIRFRPDGRSILTQFHRTARLWDVATRTPTGPVIGPFDAIYHTTFSPDSRLLVSWCGRQVRVWDAATAQPVPGRTFDHTADVTGVVTDRHGQILLAALADRTASFGTSAQAGHSVRHWKSVHGRWPSTAPRRRTASSPSVTTAKSTRSPRSRRRPTRSTSWQPSSANGPDTRCLRAR